MFTTVQKMKRDLTTMLDVQKDILDILETAEDMKKKRDLDFQPLKGKVLAMIFEKSSTRTRVSFEVGMIELRGPNVFKGYWRNPEKTASEFRPDGFFITGDLAKIDAAGYVHLVGRSKDLIISGGYNVYPKEVEAEIDAIEGVIESAVIGVPHPDLGEGVTAAVVIEPGSGLSGEDIGRALDGRLARFKLPKRIVLVPELPRNAMGKVQKNLLRAEFKDVYETGS